MRPTVELSAPEIITSINPSPSTSATLVLLCVSTPYSSGSFISFTMHCVAGKSTFMSFTKINAAGVAGFLFVKVGMEYSLVPQINSILLSPVTVTAAGAEVTLVSHKAVFKCVLLPSLASNLPVSAA